MNPANWITVARIALVPVFLWLAYMRTDGGAIASLVVFGVAALSDRIDGQLARKHKMVSRLGEFLDPTADKLLVGAALYVLVDVHAFPLWVALVIAVREVAVQILRTRIVAGGGTLPASSMGKLKTVLQAAMVCWWLYPAEPNLVHWAFLAVVLVLTVWSGLEYFKQAVRTTEEARA